MLALNSPRWQELEHARGDGSDIPTLLRLLEEQRTDANAQMEQDLWHQLWDRLEHQLTVYEASYATVPHLIRIVSLSNRLPSSEFFLLPAVIEVSRKLGLGDAIPEDLAAAYHQAVRQIPLIVGQFTHLDWDADLSRSIIAALAVAKGQVLLADIIIDLRPDSIEEYYQWKGWTYHKGFGPDSDTHSVDSGFDTSDSE